MRQKRTAHPDASQLENYALSKLVEPELGEVEEHLLICDACRKHLEENETYIHSMRHAAAGWRDAEPVRRARAASGVFPALAAMLLACGVAAGYWWTQTTPAPVSLALVATRGAGITQIQAGRPLILRPDLQGLPAASSYHLIVADQRGNTTFQSDFSVNSGIRIPAQMPGLYFVQVYGGGKLMREYGLQINAAP